MDEKDGIALEVEASEGLNGVDIAARAIAVDAAFAVVTEQGSAVGVLPVDELGRTSRPGIEIARQAPSISRQAVQVELPDGEKLDVNVAVQGAELLLWDRGHEQLVMRLAGRSPAAALSNRVLGFAASDIKLPGPGGGLPPRSHTYACANGHYEQRRSDDPDRECGSCERRLFRV